MEVAHWIVGPQIIGLIVLIVGTLQKQFPPKSINNWYGYRTDLSTQNQQTWDEGNSYSARMMIRIGLLLIVIGLIASALIPVRYEMAMIALIIVCGPTFAITMRIKTENHLEKTFPKKTGR